MIRLFCLLLLVSGLIACDSHPTPHREQFLVFGTVVEITIADAPKSKASAAIREIEQDFQQMHDQWHAWRAGGRLAEVNAAFARGETITVDPRLTELFSTATDYSVKSDHLFNPAISQLINLWGFHGADPATWTPPSDEAIQALLAKHPRMTDIQIRGAELSCANPAVKLDFGAVAKGYAVDLALQKLKQSGIRDAIVNAGGNLRVIGENHGRAWRVGIRHPNGKDVLAAVSVTDGEGVFTSGGYERYHEYQGKRYAHIIDPRTGYPVDQTVSITVIYPNGAIADAASTALAVAGQAEWQRIARQMGIRYVLLMDATGTVYMNPEMADRVEFTVNPPPPVVIQPLEPA